MATGTGGGSIQNKISRYHLECSICQESYQQPKVLDCQHSFCEQCLVKYRYSQHQNAREIPCPVCRRHTQLPETGIQGLKTNFYIIGLAEDLTLQENLASSFDTKPICEICDEGNEATRRCLDCAQNVCSKCGIAHLRFATSSGHTMTTIDDIRQGRVTLQKHRAKCKNHEGEVTRFYCTTCEQLICRDCTVLDHCKPAHEYTECGRVASKYKQSVSDLCSPLQRVLNDFMKSQENVLRVKRELGKAIEVTVAEGKKRAAEIMADVTAEENGIIDEIGRIHKDRNEKLDEYEKTLGKMTEGIQHSLETAKDVTSTASDSDFLSLYPIISKDLTFLASQNPPSVDERLAFLKFKRSQETVDIDLGELQLKTDKWKLLGKFDKRRSRPGELDWAHGLAGLKPDEIAVADWENKRVVICSTQGCQKSVIPLQGFPWDVAVTPTHDRLVVVCLGLTDVKVFNKDRKLALEFPTVPRCEVGNTAVDLRSVAVKTDGTIVVGDVKRKVLTEHSPTDGSLIHTIPVKAEPWYLAVDCSDRVVISRKGPTVILTDGNSATLFTVSPTIEGKQVQRCTGVCCDSSGIYIAMHNDGDNTGHIHRYDTRGKFICCVADRLHRPQGMSFTADGQHVVVADDYSVKMYRVV